MAKPANMLKARAGRIRKPWTEARRVRPARFARSRRPIDRFGLFALVRTWMDADVIADSVANLHAQGFDRVYLMDNGSNDDTIAAAERAGASVALRLEIPGHRPRLHAELMTVVARTLTARADADAAWWLFADADEFAHGPYGQTIREYLASVDPRCRVVGSHFYNHYPEPGAVHRTGVHPADAQPLVEAVTRSKCGAGGHWKHQLLRFDRDGGPIATGKGNHLPVGQRLREPRQGLIVHHFRFRDREVIRRRLTAAFATEANGHSRVDPKTTMDIRGRLDRLDVIYSGRWDELPATGTRYRQGPLRLVPWRDLIPSAHHGFARWNEPAGAETPASHHGRNRG